MHEFYIPVMGTGFTIDSPLFIAKYGISSTVSLVDDILIEQMRKFWCERSGKVYEAVDPSDQDARAMRITAYLNLMQDIIDEQILDIKNSDFTPDSEITRYFELLPENTAKELYSIMLQTSDQARKLQLQEQLRQLVVAGTIDVNIMTKLDCQHYSKDGVLPYEFCDAAAALRGYANSNLASSIVLSAGFNPSLYGYLAKFADFFPDTNGVIKKKLCLKVSDYRSAAIQGKYLAKHGLWVSEYSIESPLNCGGHAFINDGQLLGPILAEFKQRKQELQDSLYSFYKIALTNMQKACADGAKQVIKITAQGGIGTHNEHKNLIEHYSVDAIGWGSPFLLVPEATNVDQPTLDKLISAQDDDVFLSAASPLGIPFWNLKNSSSEELRLERIKNNVPGAPCVKGYTKFNQEFTKKPICRASREYQKLKLQQLETSDLPGVQKEALKQDILSKACICHELSGCALLKNHIDDKMASAICPGPNIINFKKIATLKEMVDHIYGRCCLIANKERPHVFVREIQLQINHLLSEVKNASLGLPARSEQKLTEVKANLKNGIEYYKQYAHGFLLENKDKFLLVLDELYSKIDGIKFTANN